MSANQQDLFKNKRASFIGEIRKTTCYEIHPYNLEQIRKNNRMSDYKNV